MNPENDNYQAISMVIERTTAINNISALETQQILIALIYELSKVIEDETS